MRAQSLHFPQVEMMRSMLMPEARGPPPRFQLGAHAQEQRDRERQERMERFAEARERSAGAWSLLGFQLCATCEDLLPSDVVLYVVRFVRVQKRSPVHTAAAEAKI